MGYESWIRVVWVIGHEAPDEGLALAEKFSRQCPEKFDADGLFNVFNQANGKLTFGSALHWLKDDNPDAFDKYNARQLRPLLRAACDETEHSMAKVLYHLYSDRFACVVIKERPNWFEFAAHRWTEVNSVRLKLLMSTEVADKFRAEISKEMQHAGDEGRTDDEKKQLDNRVQQLNKMVHKLGRTSFKNQCTEQCVELFIKETKEFYDKFDENRALLGFNNGVYDLDANEFRDGRPEDLLTLSTGYAYTDQVDEHVRDELLKFYNSLFNSPEVIQYALTVMAYHLHGRKWAEQFWVRTGSGGNGKGVDAALVESTFGEYFYSPDITIFTQKKMDASKCCSEIARAKPKRILITTEPESDDKLQVGTTKKFTGGDKIQARELYKEAMEFRPQFGVNIQSNGVPELSAFDGGVVRRMRVLSYPNKFVEYPKFENERQLDTRLKERFDNVEYAQQLMLILLNYYHTYVRYADTLETPSSVMEFTNKYLAEQDAVGSFLANNVQITGSKSDHVLSQDLLRAFNNSDFGTALSQRAFANMMSQKGHNTAFEQARTRRKCYYGLRINVAEETFEDDEEC